MTPKWTDDIRSMSDVAWLGNRSRDPGLSRMVRSVKKESRKCLPHHETIESHFDVQSWDLQYLGSCEGSDIHHIEDTGG